MTSFIEKKLKLKVNEEKSAVGKPNTRVFLGVSFYQSSQGTRVYVPAKSKKKFEQKLKKLTNKTRSIDMESRIKQINYLIQGWGNYFKVGDIRSYARTIDRHIRRRLRACRWKEWKKVSTRYRNLVSLGIENEAAFKMANTRKGYWRSSNNPIINLALDNKYWVKLNLKSLTTVIN